MKKSHLLLSFIVIFLVGCGKRFTPLYESAQKAFSEKNYIVTIDNITDALRAWEPDDDVEQKGKAYELLGRSYHRLRKFDKAIEAYSQAIKTSHNTYQAAFNLGKIYLTSNQPKLASMALKKALRMKKDDPNALLLLGNVYYEMRQYNNALLNYKRIIDVSPGVREALQQIPIARAKLKKNNPKPVKNKRRR